MNIKEIIKEIETLNGEQLYAIEEAIVKRRSVMAKEGYDKVDELIPFLNEFNKAVETVATDSGFYNRYKEEPLEIDPGLVEMNRHNKNNLKRLRKEASDKYFEGLINNEK